MVNTLNTLSTQYKSGTMNKKTKDDTLALLNKNIANAGGDRTKGMEATRNMLKNPTVAPTTGVTGSVKPIKTIAETGEIKPLKTGTDTSVGYEGPGTKKLDLGGLGLIKTTSPVFKNETGGLTTGMTDLTRNKPKPPVTGTETTPTLDTTKTGTTPTLDTTKTDTTLTTPTGTESTAGTGIAGMTDTNGDGIFTADELTGDYKTFYDQLSETDKQIFLKTGKDVMAKNQKIATDYANFQRDIKTMRDRATEDEATRLKMKGITDEITTIQDNATIRRAQDGVNKLKQSIAYLGNMGMPGSSGQRIASLDGQVKEGVKSLGELQKLLSLSKSARQEGEMAKAREYERQMEDITNKLNDNVDKSIQNAYNTLTAADNNGKLDTVEELTNFRNKMYRDLDQSITGMTNASLEQLGVLSDAINTSIKLTQEREQLANTVNQDMSAVRGYYVDGNGRAITDVNGGTIKIPAQIPKGFEPFVSNGKFFSPKMDAEGNIMYDENGAPVFTSTALQDEVSVTSEMANGFLNAVNSGAMTAAQAIELAPSLASNPNFLNGLKGEGGKAEKPIKIGTDENGMDIFATYDSTTNSFKKVGVNGQTTNVSNAVTELNSDEGLQSIVDFSTGKRGRENLQCGELVNDYWTKMTGSRAGIGDTLESKLQTVDRIGKVEQPEVGGIMVSNPAGNKVGHTGIVQSINDDGSVTILEANAEGYKDGQPPVLRTYSQEEYSDPTSPLYMNFSRAPDSGVEDTKTVINPNAIPSYRKYIEEGVMPSKDALKGMKMTSGQFQDNATQGYDQYLTNKAKEISDTYPTLDLEYTPTYAGMSATQKEKLNESLTKIGDIDNRINQLKTLFEKQGTEVWPTKAKTQMQTLRKQIILKAKEMENLGVLNGPDLGILEDLLPETTGFISGVTSFDKNTLAKLENIQNNYRMDAKTKGINYGAKINFGDSTQNTGSNLSNQSSDEEILNYLNK